MSVNRSGICSSIIADWYTMWMHRFQAQMNGTNRWQSQCHQKTHPGITYWFTRRIMLLMWRSRISNLMVVKTISTILTLMLISKDSRMVSINPSAPWINYCSTQYRNVILTKSMTYRDLVANNALAYSNAQQFHAKLPQAIIVIFMSVSAAKTDIKSFGNMHSKTQPLVDIESIDRLPHPSD